MGWLGGWVIKTHVFNEKYVKNFGHSRWFIRYNKHYVGCYPLSEGFTHKRTQHKHHTETETHAQTQTTQTQHKDARTHAQTQKRAHTNMHSHTQTPHKHTHTHTLGTNCTTIRDLARLSASADWVSCWPICYFNILWRQMESNPGTLCAKISTLRTWHLNSLRRWPLCLLTKEFFQWKTSLLRFTDNVLLCVPKRQLIIWVGLQVC
jgi:hypothetical protein